MLEIERFSGAYRVRRLSDADVPDILKICEGNPILYRFCGYAPSAERVRMDMRVAPPGIPPERKHYVGLFDGDALVAVLDVIDGFPRADVAFIGFFMMNPARQGRGVGSAIIAELCAYLKRAGMAEAHLAINKGNPQATRFWTKNGFVIKREVEREHERDIVLYAVRAL